LSTDTPVVTFHLGFLLSAAIVCATIHAMILIVEPDFKERDTHDSWLRQIRFLQFMMALPLVAFFMTHSDQGVEAFTWFLGTSTVSALLFMPVEGRFRGVRHTDAPKEKPQLRPREEAEEHFREVSRTHMRILLGNFALGLLMGGAILVPFVSAILAVTFCHRMGLLSEAQAQSTLRYVPGLCTLFVPILMPLAFLVLGPLTLRLTQGARSMTDVAGWKERWERVRMRAAILGYRHMDAMQLLELPWNKAGFRNAFFLGLPSRWNPFRSAVFYVRGIDEILNGTEVEFVIGHEAAHGMTRHAVKRMNLGMGLFLFFAISQVMALMLRSPALSLGLAVGIFVWGYHLMNKQGELQEFEADIMAVNLLGGTTEAVEAAEGALRKLDQFNLRATQPLTEKRIAYIKATFAVAQAAAKRGDDEGDGGRKAA
jgi:Zn-dependent protease with chaperone function